MLIITKSYENEMTVVQPLLPVLSMQNFRSILSPLPSSALKLEGESKEDCQIMMGCKVERRIGRH